MASQLWQLINEFAYYFADHEYSVLAQPDEEGWNLQRNGEPDVLIRIGENTLHENSAPPRFMMIPRDAQFGYADRPGAQKQNGAGKQLRRRLWRIQTYCWAQSRELAEGMLLNAIQAYQHFHNAIDFADEVWETEQPGAAGPVTEGVIVSFFAIFDVQCLSKIQPMTRPNGFRLSVTELDTTEVIIK